MNFEVLKMMKNKVSNHLIYIISGNNIHSITNEKATSLFGAMPKHWLTLLLFLFLCPSYLTAQPPKFSVYDFESRLSKDLIKDIAIDKEGFVWTATDKGVLRYDGQKTLFFKDQIPGGFAKGLLLSKNGRLLVLHDSGLTEVVTQADTVGFKLLLSGKPNDSVGALHFPKTVFEDAKGKVWIGENQSIVLLEKGKMKKYRMGNNIDFGVLTRSFSFVQDTGGRVWVISHSGVLFYFDDENNTFVEQAVNQQLRDVTCMEVVEGEKVWVGTTDGVFELNLTISSSPLPVRRLGGPTQVSCALYVPGQGVFIGTWKDGLYFVPNLTNYQPERVIGLPFNDVVALCFDSPNGVWVTGREHSALIKPVLFEQVDLGTEKPASITSLSLTDNGNLLIIGDENEANKQDIYELENGKIIWQLDPIGNPFGNIPLAAMKSNDYIWIGDLGGSIYYINELNKIPVKFGSIKTSNSPISNIVKDKKGNIWIAGNIHNGIIKLMPNGELEFFKNDGTEYARVIYPAPDGTLWAGGNGADYFLFKYDDVDGSFVNLSKQLTKNLKDNIEVKDMLSYDSNNLLVATTNGVYKILFSAPNSISLEQVSLDKIPDDEPSNALAIAPDGMLWIATTSGLLAHDGVSSFLFDKSSGLPANSFTDKGLLFDYQGNLWVGTASGLSVFSSDRSDFPLTPSPIIEAVRENGNHYHLDEAPIQFNAGIEISFLALSFPADQVIYRTRLLEKDTNWSVPDKAKQRFMSGLAPGKYTFQVAAQQQEGMRWSEPTTFDFEVAKPWYQEIGYICLMLATTLALVILVARLYNLRLIKQKKNLEKIIRKRTDEINRQKNEIIDQQDKLIVQNKKMQELKEEQFKNELEYKNKQLTTYTLNLIQKNQTLKDLRLEINQVIRSSSKSSYSEMRKLLNMIDYSFRKDEDWDNFKLFFEEVHAGFFEDLIKKHPKLTAHDLRHCALIRLNLSIEETSTIVGISADSIKTARFRLKKKMDLDSQTDLLEHLMTI